MKTGMEWPLLGLLLLIVLAVGFQAWNSVQVELSAAQVSALAAGQQLPVPAGFLTFGELGASWIVKAVIGTVLGGLGLALGYKAWDWLQVRKRQNNWQAGPNANYQRQPATPRAPSEAEFLRLAMYQQMAANGNRPPPARMNNGDDDEPKITF